VAAEEVTRDAIERQLAAAERQLAAAPRIAPGRRFTIRELRRRPELREFMPAVDVNSIHTDAVGSEEYNQMLSEKRAEAVKRALTEYFNIPPENLVTIGYGERFLKIPVPDAEPENRRVVIRRITPLVER